MYQNNLHKLIDDTKKPNGVIPLESFTSENQRRRISACIKSIPFTAKDAICFSHDLDSIPAIEINGSLLKIPYKRTWFEFKCDEPETTVGFLCFESPDGVFDFYLLCLTPVVCKSWVHGGLFNVSIDGDKVITRGFMGKPDQLCAHLIECFYCYLTALNCCNITRTEHKPKPSQQSVRRALGRQPLFSTWTLEIDLDRTERELPGESCGGHASKRLHLCRGHARQHKPGQWCWVRAHVRGDKSLGMIHKDYATH